MAKKIIAVGLILAVLTISAYADIYMGNDITIPGYFNGLINRSNVVGQVSKDNAQDVSIAANGNHSELNQLNWSVAGHILDSNLYFINPANIYTNDNTSFLELNNVTGSTSSRIGLFSGTVITEQSYIEMYNNTPSFAIQALSQNLDYQAYIFNDNANIWMVSQDFLGYFYSNYIQTNNYFEFQIQGLNKIIINDFGLNVYGHIKTNQTGIGYNLSCFDENGELQRNSNCDNILNNDINNLSSQKLNKSDYYNASIDINNLFNNLSLKLNKTDYYNASNDLQLSKDYTNSSNTSMKSYVDNGLSGKEPSIIGSTANVFWNGLKQWITLGIGNITGLQTALDLKDTNLTNANTSMKSYVDNQDNSTLQSSKDYTNSSNTSMKSYVDLQDNVSGGTALSNISSNWGNWTNHTDPNAERSITGSTSNTFWNGVKSFITLSSGLITDFTAAVRGNVSNGTSSNLTYNLATGKFDLSFVPCIGNNYYQSADGKNISCAAGGSSSSPLTVKGDIYVRNTTTDTRQPIGNNGEVLTVDSTTNTGMKWASVASSGTPFSKYNFTRQDIYTNNTVNYTFGNGSTVLSLSLSTGHFIDGNCVLVTNTSVATIAPQFFMNITGSNAVNFAVEYFTSATAKGSAMIPASGTALNESIVPTASAGLPFTRTEIDFYSNQTSAGFLNISMKASAAGRVFILKGSHCQSIET